jgi:hypothetical protein
MYFRVESRFLIRMLHYEIIIKLFDENNDSLTVKKHA